jgi:undecaprenyl-diphosphatase
MQTVWKLFARCWAAETRLLVSLLAIAGLLLTFGLIADVAMEDEVSAFDRSVLLAFREAPDSKDPIGPHWLQGGARDITALGSFAVLGIVLIAVVGYSLLIGRRVAAWLMLGAVLGGVALNSLLKLFFARPRPELVAPAVEVYTASFPSGHAAISAITYLTLAALLARTTTSRQLRIYFIATGAMLTFLIGLSRVYLGVHYPTDVLAGWCVGAAWALGCWALMTRLQQRGEAEPPAGGK